MKLWLNYLQKSNTERSHWGRVLVLPSHRPQPQAAGHRPQATGHRPHPRHIHYRHTHRRTAGSKREKKKRDTSHLRVCKGKESNAETLPTKRDSLPPPISHPRYYPSPATTSLLLLPRRCIPKHLFAPPALFVHPSRKTTVLLLFTRSYAKVRKMPPKKAAKEEKIMLGRPGNNLKSGIVGFFSKIFPPPLCCALLSVLMVG